MNTDPEHADLDKKRVLKKVRTHFLARRPEQEEELLVIVPKFINPSPIYLINGAWGFVVEDRHVHMGRREVNSCLEVKDIRIEDNRNSKQVVLKPQILNQSVLMPWEYSVERLESFGDLELATVAHKLRGKRGNFSRLNSEYHRMIKSGDREMIEFLEKARQDVQEWKEKTERMYPWSMTKIIYNKNGTSLHSMTFSESILKEIGQSVEGAASWAKRNGILILFNYETKLDMTFGKKVLGGHVPVVPKVVERPEFEDWICDLNGNQRRVVVQKVDVFEPTEDEIIISAYVLLKDNHPCKNGLEMEDNIENDCDQRGMKYMKHEI